MAYGDVGGSVTELIITMRTPIAGRVDIAKGDAVWFVGEYIVANVGKLGDPVFGQAMADVSTPDTNFPVKVHGICIFEYDGGAQYVPQSVPFDSVAMSDTPGKVTGWASGKGINLRVDVERREVHVLL